MFREKGFRNGSNLVTRARILIGYALIVWGKGSVACVAPPEDKIFKPLSGPVKRQDMIFICSRRQ